MNSRFTSRLISVATLIYLFALAGQSPQAASGYSASLRTPPSWVSSYQEPSEDYSVSLSQPVYPHISLQMKRQPKLEESSFEQEQFRFQTEYFRYGRETKTLVPVAVDAKSYSAFRRSKNKQDSFDKMATSSLDQARQQRGQGGLGLRVDLPARLDGIFGEGGAGLRVSGYRKIMFSGRSQWTDGANSPILKQSKFPSLNMEQMYQFDITGTIGSKITVKVSQDSHTDIPLSNRIQIRYKGDDDDVLKTIEAGNTNLSLPNTQFVGYSSQIRGLFGVKAEAQLGALYLTAIASQEKGSSERTKVTPTGEESATIIRDYDYDIRRVFDLGDQADFQPGDSVLRVFVYQQITGSERERPPDAVWAELIVDPDNPAANSAQNIYLTSPSDGVTRIPEDEYFDYSFPDQNRHYIVFQRALRDYSVGIYMEILRSGDTVRVGDISTTGTLEDPYILKLLYSRSQTPSYKTWDYMWRNVYRMPTGTVREDLDIKIYKGLDGSEDATTSLEYQAASSGQQNYIEIFGLDQYDQSGRNVPDGKIDERESIYREDWNLLIFPSSRPFIDTTRSFSFADGDTTQHLIDPAIGIYDYESSTRRVEASKYFMKVFSKSRNNVIRLGRPNVIEGSERVTANGAPLTRGTDYRIEYDFGRITLLSEEAKDPNADIDIEFEYAPFLAIQKKSLLGFRTEYEFSKDFKIGSTILYKSDKAQDRKPRVGMETTRSFVFDVDASLALQPNFLTRLADALPIVRTETPSNLRLSGEVAQSHPNPNVEGVAYVDDFEASAEQLSLGTGRTQWQKSSLPLQLEGLSTVRSKLLWHNPREALRVEEVYDRDTEAGQSTLRSMRLVFRPNTLDTVWSYEGEDSTLVYEIDTLTATSWAGIMRDYSSRVDQERVQVFEIRARANSGKMHIDFGKIDEDINGDGSDYTEDGFPTQQFDDDEDVGLDSLADIDEPFYHPVLNPDPNGDNWYFENYGKCPLPTSLCNDATFQDTAWNNDSLYYEWLNGTEGNKVDYEYLEEPDKEKLGREFDRSNSYFTYTIDFGDVNPDYRLDSTFKASTDTIKAPWYTYRIPIRDPSFWETYVDGGVDEPEWTGERITHVRIWFEGEPFQDTPDTVEIADWYFVQSNWRDTVKFNVFGENSQRSTNLLVASVSEEDETFSPPPDVEPYEDPTTGTIEAQRGLEMKFDSLDYRDLAEATKKLITVDKYAGYRTLEMYVYGALPEEYANSQSIMFYFRLGRDSLNFYEQQKRISNGWDPSNYIKMDFNEITALKDAAQRVRERSEWSEIDTVAGDLRVVGDPNLNEIKYFAAGIRNLDPSSFPSGVIWLDELRVTDVRRDVGTAGRFSASGNIADLATYNFTFQSQDPYFRGLSSSTRGGSDQNLGSGQTDTRISFSSSWSIDKFLPRSWNARVPVSLSFSRGTQTPLLRTGSDIVLPEEIRSRERTISESRTLSVSPSFNRPGKNPLFSLFLNRLSGTSFSYRRSTQQSPRVPYSFSEGVSVRSGMNLGLKSNPTLPILFWTKWIPILKRVSETELGLYPRSWNVSGTFDRTLSISDDIEGNRRSNFKRDLTARMDLAYDLFQNLTLSLRMDTRRDLSNSDDVNLSLSNLKLGLEMHYGQSFSANYKPKILPFLTTDLGFSSSYSDDFERSTENLRSSMSSAWSVSGIFDHMKLLGGQSGEGDRRFRGRGRSARGSKVEDDDDGRPFYDPPLAVLRFLTGWINPPRYSYGTDFKYSLPGITERPGAKYRFGLSRTPNVELVSSTRNPSSTESESYDIASGFTFLGGISTDVSYRMTIGRDLIKRGSRYENISTKWPDLSIRIQKFRTLPLIKGIVNKFIDVFSPRTSYSRSVRETKDIDAGFTTSVQENISQSPLLQLNFKLFRALSLSSSYAVSREKREDYNTTTGEFRSRSESTTKSLGGTAKYSFSAPGGLKLPMFGRLKFRSQVNFSVDIKYNRSLSETWDVTGRTISSNERSEFSIRPDISYSFSQQIRGGLTMRWSDTDNSGKKNHLREVSIWMEISF